MHKLRALRFVAVMTVLLSPLLAAAPALAKKPKPKPKPNLVVTEAALKSNSYAFWKEDDTVTVEDVTKNVGAARSKATVTRVYLVHGGKRYQMLSRRVPALGPHESHRAETSGQPFKGVAYPIGAYTLMICADARKRVDESDESNCKSFPPAHFFVIPRGWVGSIDGSETDPLTTKWASTKAQFIFDGYEGGGLVSYLFTGSITWTTSGTDAEGCTVSGTGSRSYENDDSLGALLVDYLNGNYSGQLQDTTGSPYDVTFGNCDDPPPPEGAPWEPAVWVPTVSAKVPLPFGSTALPGSPSRFADSLWSWNLQATFGS